MSTRMPTYVTLKDVKKRWGHGQEDVFPVTQFEKLWVDMTMLPEVAEPLRRRTAPPRPAAQGPGPARRLASRRLGPLGRPPLRVGVIERWPEPRSYILTVSCPDTVGLVAAVSGLVASWGGWLTEVSNHSDAVSNRFFMRNDVRADSLPFGIEEFRAGFLPLARRYAMQFSIRDTSVRKRVVILVSARTTASRTSSTAGGPGSWASTCAV